MWEYKVGSNVNIGNFVFVKTPIVKFSNLTCDSNLKFNALRKQLNIY